MKVPHLERLLETGGSLVDELLAGVSAGPAPIGKANLSDALNDDILCEGRGQQVSG